MNEYINSYKEVTLAHTSICATHYASPELATSGLVAEIALGAVTSSFPSLNKKMRKTLNRANLQRTAELDRRYFKTYPNLRKLADLGMPFVLYTIDNTMDIGREELLAAMGSEGTVFPCFEGSFYAGKPWFVNASGYKKGQGMTLIMTLEKIAGCFQRFVGMEPNITRSFDAYLKRLRRASASAVYTFFGTHLRTEAATFGLNDGASGSSDRFIAAARYYFRMTRVEYCGTMRNIVATEFTVLVPTLNDANGKAIPEAVSILENTDGAGVMNFVPINEALKGLDPLFKAFRKFDGVMFNMMFDLGQIKGHVAAAREGLLADTFVLWDPKSELKMVDGTVRISILARLKRTAQVNMNIQSAIVMDMAKPRLGDVSILEELGNEFVDDLYALGEDSDAIAAKLGVIEETPVDESDDTALRGLDALKASLFVLKENLSQMRNGFKRNGKHYNYLSMDSETGREIAGSAGILRQQRAAKQVLRLLTAQTVKINEAKFPLRDDVAVSAYGMFDLSSMEHADPLKAGRGLYFNRGVLQYGEVAVNHTLTHGPGGLTYSGQLHAEGVLNRNPLGHRKHVVGFATAIHSEYYEGNSDSCFLFFSVASRNGSSFSKLALSIMGGADFDDLCTFWIRPNIVEHVKNLLTEPFDMDAIKLPSNFNEKATATPMKSGNKFAGMKAQQPVIDVIVTPTVANQFYLTVLPDSGLLGSTVNAGLMYTLMSNTGLAMPPACLTIDYFNVNQEHVIDASKMSKGSMVNLEEVIEKSVNNFLMHVPSLGRHLARRFPAWMQLRRAEAGLPDLEIVDTPYDAALVGIQARLAEYVEFFSKTYMDPNNHVFFSYMLETEYRFRRAQARPLAVALRNAYGKNLSEAGERLRLETAISPDFKGVNPEELEAYIRKTSMTEAAEAVYTNLTINYADDIELLEEAFIALYQIIYRLPPVLGPAIAGQDRLWNLRPDTLLYDKLHFALFMSALRRAKVQQFNRINGITPVRNIPFVAKTDASDLIEAPQGASQRRLLPGLSLTVVNGWKSKDPSNMAAAKAFAATSPVVDVTRLHANSKSGMAHYWRINPVAAANKTFEDVLVVSHKATGFIAYVSSREIEKFDLHTHDANTVKAVLGLGAGFTLKATLLPAVKPVVLSTAAPVDAIAAWAVPEYVAPARYTLEGLEATGF
jgi:hypothetical protein